MSPAAENGSGVHDEASFDGMTEDDHCTVHSCEYTEVTCDVTE